MVPANLSLVCVCVCHADDGNADTVVGRLGGGGRWALSLPAEVVFIRWEGERGDEGVVLVRLVRVWHGQLRQSHRGRAFVAALLFRLIFAVVSTKRGGVLGAAPSASAEASICNRRC